MNTTAHRAARPALRAAAIATTALAGALLSSGALAVTLLPTVPLAYAETWASTQLNANVYLADTDEWLNSYRTIDYASATSSQRGVAAYLAGGSTLSRNFAQYGAGSPTVQMGAYASADFGVNKVRALMVGAGVAATRNEYGSTAASSAYRQTYIDNTLSNWNWNDTIGIEDYNKGGYVYAPSSTQYHYEVGSNDLVFDSPGLRYQDPNGGQHWFITNVPTTMPEVVIERNPGRYVNAYSRWEDVYYFGPAAGSPAGTTGTATLHIQIDGLLTGDYTGSYSFQMRDWAHKDQYGTYLAQVSAGATPDGNALNQVLDVTIPFIYGQPNYVKAEAWASLSGEGDIDLSQTIKVVGIDVPTGTAVYSYGNYLGGTGLGFAVSGGVDGGTLPGGAGAFLGTGGGQPPVPEPGTWAMLAAGLATLASLSRRRRVGGLGA